MLIGGEVCSYERANEAGRTDRWLSGARAAAGASLWNPRQPRKAGSIPSGGQAAQAALNQCPLSVQRCPGLEEGSGFMDGEFWNIRVRPWSRERKTTVTK